MKRESTRGATLALIAILLGAAVIRLWGLDWGLPFPYHPDEGSILFHSLGFGTGDLNPHWFRWPSLVMYVMFGFYGALYVVGKLAGLYGAPADLVRHYVSDLSWFWLMGRALSAAAGVATVWVTYLFGRRSYGKSVGLTAAAILAVTYLHVRDSHYATPDVVSTLLATLSLLAALTAVSRGRAGRLILSALLAGLAASAKYPAGIAAVGTLVGLGLLWRRGRVSVIQSVVIILAVPAGFLIGTPYALLSRDEFLRDVVRQFTMVSTSGVAQEPTSFVAGLREIVVRTFGHGVGWPVTILAIVGAALPLRLWRGALKRQSGGRQDRATISGAAAGRALALWYTAAVIVLMSLLTVKRATYLTPALPMVAFLAALGIRGVFERLTTRPYRALVATVLVVAAAAYPSVRFVAALGAADTRTQALEWVSREIAPGARIAVEDYGPVLNPTVAQLEVELELGSTAVGSWQGPKRELNRVRMDIGARRQPQHTVYRIDWGVETHMLPSTLEVERLETAIDSFGIEYVILSSKAAPWRPMVGAAPPRNPGGGEFVDWLVEHCVPVAVFADETGMPEIDRGRGRSFHNPAIHVYRVVRRSDSSSDADAPLGEPPQHAGGGDVPAEADEDEA